MRRASLLAVMSLSLSACTPLAVTAVVGGAVVTAASAPAASRDCDGEGCAYTKVLAMLGIVLGVGLAAGGAIALVAK